jgi:hypothetical protein
MAYYNNYISKIAEKGKFVFKDTVTSDEYTVKKSLARMRASKQTPKEKKNKAQTS